MKTLSYFLCALLVCGALLPTAALAQDKGSVVVLLEGSLGDKGPNDALRDALHAAEQNLGVTTRLIASPQSEELESAFMRTLEEKPLLIVAAGITPHTLLMNYAGNYRRQRFLALEGYIPAENITSLLFYDAQGAYLAGTAAVAGGLARTSGAAPDKFTLGFLADRDSRANTIMATAYRDAVKAQAPSAHVRNSYTGTTTDKEAVRTAALRLLTDGAQVVFPACGVANLAALEAVQEQKALAIAQSEAQMAAAPQAVLAAYTKNMRMAMHTAIDLALKGQLKGRELLEMTLQNGGITVTVNPQLPAATRTAVQNALDTTTKAITDGKVNLPAIKPADGCNCR